MPSSPAAFTSMLSTPDPILTIILKALNFSRSSFVRIIVCHIKAPTASFNVDCASQKATVATSFKIGISMEQSRPSSRATNGRMLELNRVVKVRSVERNLRLPQPRRLLINNLGINTGKTSHTHCSVSRDYWLGLMFLELHVVVIFRRFWEKIPKFDKLLLENKDGNDSCTWWCVCFSIVKKPVRAFADRKMPDLLTRGAILYAFTVICMIHSIHYFTYFIIPQALEGTFMFFRVRVATPIKRLSDNGQLCNYVAILIFKFE
ncbi:Protein of unknown function [Cotesia congregata]|uniref:Uncharacterized protein n=1 Tax=Cotesia congregata TaxID=51543 RepID=A0A8J2EI56_COTCN|nr:Protein of unknown function [Cotesia congregata]